jgi:hypothetical protein
MFPLKLTENLYLNPEGIADIEYTPKGKLGNDPFFNVRFLNNQLLAIHLKSDEADEAFLNWRAAYHRRRGQFESSHTEQQAISLDTAETHRRREQAK